MREMTFNEMRQIQGGDVASDSACIAYGASVFVVAMAAGMFLGPFGAGAAAGFLFTIDNPCS